MHHWRFVLPPQIYQLLHQNLGRGIVLLRLLKPLPQPFFQIGEYLDQVSLQIVSGPLELLLIFSPISVLQADPLISLYLLVALSPQ